MGLSARDVLGARRESAVAEAANVLPAGKDRRAAAAVSAKDGCGGRERAAAAAERGKWKASRRRSITEAGIATSNCRLLPAIVIESESTGSDPSKSELPVRTHRKRVCRVGPSKASVQGRTAGGSPGGARRLKFPLMLGRSKGNAVDHALLWQAEKSRCRVARGMSGNLHV